MTVNHSMRHAVRRVLAVGAIAAIGAGALAAQAKPAPKPQPQTTPAPTSQNQKGQAAALQTVVVTGSLISTSSIETPNPVQVISAASFVKSGFTSFNQVMQNISANGQGNLSQSFSFAFAGGGSGIALHGLTVGDTLVMIDGQRTVPYPLLDDNERDFVDVSAFPMMAVKRVEVLSSGGSSLYGGDAIAGVVNVILRKTYQGFKVTAETGQSQHRDATMEHLAFIGGEGDLQTDGYNWWVSGEFRHEDQILASNRSGAWVNQDATPYGGYNLTPGASMLDFPFYPGGPTPTGEYPLTAGGLLINPNNPAQYTYLGNGSCHGPGGFTTSGATTAGDLAQESNMCLLPNPRAQIQPPSTRLDLLAKFHLRLPDGWLLGVEGSYFDSMSEQVSAVGGAFASLGTGNPAGFDNFAMGPGITPHTVPTFPGNITVPASYPGNPYGAPAQLIDPFSEMGPQVFTFDTSTYRLLASLTGHVAGWKLKAVVSAQESKMIERQYNGINFTALQTALNNGLVLGGPGVGASNAGSQETALFAPMMESVPSSQLDLINVNGTHDLFHLWGGEAKGAVGVEFYKEAHDDRAPQPCSQGLQVCDPTYVVGTQKVSAVYGEIHAPLLKKLTVQGTGRYDHYNNFGGAASGNLSAMYKPFHWVTFRTNYGKSFRPPTAAEGGTSGELFGLGTSNDPTLCPNPTNAAGTSTPNAPGNFPSTCNIFPVFLINGNPHLKNVRGTNWGGGIVLRPLREVNLSIDYYNIKVANDIVLGAPTGILRAPTGTALSYCPASYTTSCTKSQLVTMTTPVGLEQAVLDTYVNASETHTSGIEFGIHAHYDAGRFGRLSGSINWTHLLTYQLVTGGVSYELAGTHGPSGVSGDTGNPKDRANAQVSWEKGPWTLTANVYYTGPFSLTSPDIGVNTCGDGLGFNGYFPGFTPGVTPQSLCTVHSFTYTNFYARYQVTGGFSVHGAVNNAFNATPSLDYQTYGTGSLFYPYNTNFQQQGAIGRYFIVGATYQF